MQYIRAYDNPTIDDEIVEVLISAIEQGDMIGFTEWNAFAWLSGYYRNQSMYLRRVMSSIDYVFYNCPDIKNAEYLKPLENYDL